MASSAPFTTANSTVMGAPHERDVFRLIEQPKQRLEAHRSGAVGWDFAEVRVSIPLTPELVRVPSFSKALNIVVVSVRLAGQDMKHLMDSVVVIHIIHDRPAYQAASPSEEAPGTGDGAEHFAGGSVGIH